MITNFKLYDILFTFTLTNLINLLEQNFHNFFFTIFNVSCFDWYTYKNDISDMTI